MKQTRQINAKSIQDLRQEEQNENEARCCGNYFEIKPNISLNFYFNLLFISLFINFKYLHGIYLNEPALDGVHVHLRRWFWLTSGITVYQNGFYLKSLWHMWCQLFYVDIAVQVKLLHTPTRTHTRTHTHTHTHTHTPTHTHTHIIRALVYSETITIRGKKQTNSVLEIQDLSLDSRNKRRN